MKRTLQIMILLSCVFISLTVMTSFNDPPRLSRLQVSDNGRYLVKDNGQPFFWLGDTGWNLFVRLDREEAQRYLEDRKNKKFTVIQAHLLGFQISDSNAYGERPFVNNDFNLPNEKYWKHVDYIISKAEQLGLYMAILPAWAGSYIELKPQKEGAPISPKFLSEDTSLAYRYATFIGTRYARHTNIIWILGGDVWGRKDGIYDNLAQGLTDAAAGGKPGNILLSFHPQGGTNRPPATSTSEFYHRKSWLDFNMIQSGHRLDNKNYERIAKDYELQPVKPTMESEPCYEQHPIEHDFKKGVFTAWHIRRRAYWSLLSGGFGFTYGANGIWQMDKPGKILKQTHHNYYWYEALNFEGATQMTSLRNLMESRPVVSPERLPDQSILISKNGGVDDHIQCARASDYSYLLVYTTNGIPFTLDLSKLTSKKLQAWWFNPRDGKNYDGNLLPTGKPFTSFTNQDTMHFIPPQAPQPGNDWVLVIDDAKKKYAPPGSGEN